MWSRLIAFAAATLCFNAGATPLFVSPEGQGSICTAAQPCKHIQQAIDLALANDSILVGPGIYYENIEIPTGKDGLTISGTGSNLSWIISAGAIENPKQAPAGVAADIIVDIFSRNVTIEKLAIIHPPGLVEKRDIGVFVRPPATGATIRKNTIERQRTGDVLEPPHLLPGSRGILVFRAKDVVMEKNTLAGNYQDHIHLPTSSSLVSKNIVAGATRLGIVVIQETATSDSSGNSIEKNTVSDSGMDGIQIQGDANLISKNSISFNSGAAIRLCGPLSNPVCVAPGSGATAEFNLVTDNSLSNNSYDIVDDGLSNSID